MRYRTARFALWTVVVTLFSWPSLRQAIHLSLANGYSSQAVLVPFIAAYLIWSERERVFAALADSKWLGLALTFAGGAGFFLGVSYAGPYGIFRSVGMRLVGIFLMLAGGFAWSYGWPALRAAKFPFFVLLLALPFPSALVDSIIVWLQAGSASLSYHLFSLLGVPVYREGFVLHLPRVSIEVAKECSGINSSVALLLTAILVAWQTLRTTSRRLLLVLLTIPLSIAKNAVRIVTLTLLAVYVDPGFLTGRLHHQGGFVFFIIAIALVYPLWRLLQRSEAPTAASAVAVEAASQVAGR